MANIHVNYNRDWDRAERELQQAFALAPREANGVGTAAQLAAARGHWNEARQLAIEAVELDPLEAGNHMILGWNVYLSTGQLQEAEMAFHRGLQIAPDWGSGHYFLGEALMLEGHNEAALAEFKKETLDDGQLEGSAMAFRSRPQNGVGCTTRRSDSPQWRIVALGDGPCLCVSRRKG
jgi:tetratricopeptide (TPR) repeat protein